MTDDGMKVLIVLNTTPSKRNFNVRFRGFALPLSLDGGAVGTYVW
jgi:glucosylceramidase